MQNNLLSKSKFAALAGVNPSTVTRLCNTVLKAAVSGKKIDADHPDAVKYLADRERTQTRESAQPAATGLDTLYEEAVAAWSSGNAKSITALQRALRIGYARASKLVDLMKLNGVINPESLEPEIPTVVINPSKGTVNGGHIPKLRGQAAAKETKKRESAPMPTELPEDIQAFGDFTLNDLIEKFGTDTRFVDWLSATQKIEAINEKRLKNAQTKGELISRDLVKVGVIDTFNSAHLRLLKDGAKSIAAGVISKHSGGAELSEVEAYVSDILSSFIKPVKGKITRVLKNA